MLHTIFGLFIIFIIGYVALSFASWLLGIFFLTLGLMGIAEHEYWMAIFAVLGLHFLIRN